MLWSITNKAELYYYSSLCIYLVRFLLWPADSSECRFGYHCRRWASDCCNLHRGSRNNFFSPLLYNFILNPSMAASSNPFRRGFRGWCVFIYGNHATRWENGSSWWGYLCDVCFISKRFSEQEFFDPVGTHLCVKLLMHVINPPKLTKN